MTAPDHTPRAEEENAKHVVLPGGCAITFHKGPNGDTWADFRLPDGITIARTAQSNARAFAAALQPAITPASKITLARREMEPVGDQTADLRAKIETIIDVDSQQPIDTRRLAGRIASLVFGSIATLKRENAALREASKARTVPPELRALSEQATPGRFVAKRDWRRAFPWRVEGRDGTAHVADITRSRVDGNSQFEAPEAEANAKLFALLFNDLRDRIASDRAGGE